MGDLLRAAARLAGSVPLKLFIRASRTWNFSTVCRCQAGRRMFSERQSRHKNGASLEGKIQGRTWNHGLLTYTRSAGQPFAKRFRSGSTQNAVQRPLPFRKVVIWLST